MNIDGSRIRYHKPHDGIGHPLTPDTIEALGLVSRMPGRTETYDPDGSWVQSYQCWASSGARKELIYPQGRCSIQKKVDEEGTFVLDVHQRITGSGHADEAMQGPHTIRASIRCRNDETATPLSWRLESAHVDREGRQIPHTDISEAGHLANGEIRVQKIPGSRSFVIDSKRSSPDPTVATYPVDDSIAVDWGLIEAIQRIPFDGCEQLTFSMIEGLSLLKPKQRLVSTSPAVIHVSGKSHTLYGFRQIGFGILPMEYWLDESHKLLFIINGNRLWILDELNDESTTRPQLAHPVYQPMTPPDDDPIDLPAPPTLHGPAIITGNNRPNLLLIFTDQQTAGAMSAAGNSFVSTPALDALCERGVRFTNSYCTNPICSPSRSSIFTGRMPSETGVHRNDRAVRSGIPNMGEWFGDQSDYEPVYIGKWHVPECHTYSIPGFEVLATGMDHRGDVSDASVSRAAESFLLDRVSKRPFALAVSIVQPHDICNWCRVNLLHKELPYPEIARELPPLPANFEYDPAEPGELADFRLRGQEPVGGAWEKSDYQYYLWSYYRMVEMADAEIGRVLDALERSGHAENTVVVFTSDHGEGVAEHRFVRKNFLYDSAERVPFIMAYPGEMPEGTVDSSHMVSGMDIFPTLCDYAGIPSPLNVTGSSIRNLFEETSPTWRQSVAVELGSGRCARSIRSKEYKYVKYVNDPVEQLFDRIQDPGETKNRYRDADHASALADHRELLREWERRLDPAPDTPHRSYWTSFTT